MAAVTNCSDFGAQENKLFHCFHCVPWSDGTGPHDLHFLNAEFSANFFILLFHFHQEVSLSAISVVSPAYLKLLIFLPAILIPACASFSPAFYMMHSAYNLNEQVNDVQPWCFPIPIWNQSAVPCPVLNVAFWPAYSFLRRQVRWSGIPISLRIFHSFLSSTQSYLFTKN